MAPKRLDTPEKNDTIYKGNKPHLLLMTVWAESVIKAESALRPQQQLTSQRIHLGNFSEIGK